jgi:hypothetical protein
MAAAVARVLAQCSGGSPEWRSRVGRKASPQRGARGSHQSLQSGRPSTVGASGSKIKKRTSAAAASAAARQVLRDVGIDLFSVQRGGRAILDARRLSSVQGVEISGPPTASASGTRKASNRPADVGASASDSRYPSFGCMSRADLPTSAVWPVATWSLDDFFRASREYVSPIWMARTRSHDSVDHAAHETEAQPRSSMPSGIVRLRVNTKSSQNMQGCGVTSSRRDVPGMNATAGT